jgi:alpha-beta hydrolase superfamily lysophospholipase
MGGAIALLLHRKRPDYWDGAVLVAPMCKVCSFIFTYYYYFFLKKIMVF